MTRLTTGPTPVALPLTAMYFQVQAHSPVSWVVAMTPPDPDDPALKVGQRETAYVGVQVAGGPRAYVWSAAPSTIVAS